MRAEKQVALYESFYFRTESGRSPVKEFIDSLDANSQRKFFYMLGLLEEFGPKLLLPHAKYIGEGIFELRIRSSAGNIRILYFFFRENRIIFTNGFIKKSDKTPPRERAVAVKRRKAFLAMSPERGIE